MKRNLIAVTVVALGLAATAAVAEPTLDLYSVQSEGFKAPEATSYQAASRISGAPVMLEDTTPFNP
jgi:hypothetical protein